MISVTLDQLYGWVAAFLWPLARILGLISTAPLFGESSVPLRVKVGLGVLITIAISPAAGPLPDITPGSFAGLGVMVIQVLIGIMLGLSMKFVFAAAQSAGEHIGLQMGLSFASFFDPNTNSHTSVLSRLFNMVALMVFLAMNGHLLLVAGLVHTFEVLPIADTALDLNGVGALLEWMAEILILGVLMAVPLVTALLTMNLAMGILNRTAPQLSVFAVGFPLSLLAGLVMLTLVLPQTSPFLERLFEGGLQAFGRIAVGLAGGHL